MGLKWMGLKPIGLESILQQGSNYCNALSLNLSPQTIGLKHIGFSPITMGLKQLESETNMAQINAILFLCSKLSLLKQIWFYLQTRSILQNFKIVMVSIQIN